MSLHDSAVLSARRARRGLITIFFMHVLADRPVRIQWPRTVYVLPLADLRTHGRRQTSQQLQHASHRRVVSSGSYSVSAVSTVAVIGGRLTSWGWGCGLASSVYSEQSPLLPGSARPTV